MLPVLFLTLLSWVAGMSAECTTADCPARPRSSSPLQVKVKRNQGVLDDASPEDLVQKAGVLSSSLLQRTSSIARKQGNPVDANANDLHVDDAKVFKCWEDDDKALREEAETKMQMETASGIMGGVFGMAGAATSAIPGLGQGVAALGSFNGAVNEVLLTQQEYRHTIAGLDRDNCAQVTAMATLDLIRTQSDETVTQLKTDNIQTRDLIDTSTQEIMGAVQAGTRTILRQLETYQNENRKTFEELGRLLQSNSEQFGVLALKLDELSMKIDASIGISNKHAYDAMLVRFLDAVSLSQSSYDRLENAMIRLQDHKDSVMYLTADDVQILNWLTINDELTRDAETAVEYNWAAARQAVEKFASLAQGDFFSSHYRMILLTSVETFAADGQCRDILSGAQAAGGLMTHIRGIFEEDPMWKSMMSAIYSTIQIYDVMVLVYPEASYRREVQALAEAVTEVQIAMDAIRNEYSSPEVCKPLLAEILAAVLPTVCPLSTECKMAAIEARLPGTERMLDLGDSTFALGVFELVHSEGAAFRTCIKQKAVEVAPQSSSRQPAVAKTNFHQGPDFQLDVPCSHESETVLIHCPSGYFPRYTGTNMLLTWASYTVGCKTAINNFGSVLSWRYEKYYTLEVDGSKICHIISNSPDGESGLCPQECTGGCEGDIWACDLKGPHDIIESSSPVMSVDLNVAIQPEESEWATRIRALGNGQKLLQFNARFGFLLRPESHEEQIVFATANYRISFWLTTEQVDPLFSRRVLKVPGAYAKYEKGSSTLKWKVGIPPLTEWWNQPVTVGTPTLVVVEMTNGEVCVSQQQAKYCRSTVWEGGSQIVKVGHWYSNIEYMRLSLR